MYVHASNATGAPLLNIQFCEGKYGGLAEGRVASLVGVHLPEALNAWSGICERALLQTPGPLRGVAPRRPAHARRA